jgi:hypothetical protein
VGGEGCRIVAGLQDAGHDAGLVHPLLVGTGVEADVHPPVLRHAADNAGRELLRPAPHVVAGPLITVDQQAEQV